MAIQSYCQQNRIQCWEAPAKTLTGWELPGEFDFGIVISFGYFIPRRILKCFPLGIVNLHPSNLPHLRGPAPLIHALANGDREGGVCIIELHPESFDAGRVLKRQVFPIASDWSFADLESVAIKVGIENLVSVMDDLQHYRERAEPQNDSLATHAPKIDRSFSIISFKERTKEQIINLYRAISHIYALEGTLHLPSGRNLTVKIIKIEPTMQPSILPTNKSVCNVFYDYNLKMIFVQCACGNWLGISQLRVIGKSTLYDATKFVNGYQIGIESHFE